MKEKCGLNPKKPAKFGNLGNRGANRNEHAILHWSVWVKSKACFISQNLNMNFEIQGRRITPFAPKELFAFNFTYKGPEMIDFHTLNVSIQSELR